MCRSLFHMAAKTLAVRAGTKLEVLSITKYSVEEILHIRKCSFEASVVSASYRVIYPLFDNKVNSITSPVWRRGRIPPP
jgi:hypothetical protein